MGSDQPGNVGVTLRTSCQYATGLVTFNSMPPGSVSVLLVMSKYLFKLLLVLLSLRSATTDSDYVLCVDISIYMYTYIYIYIHIYIYVYIRQNTLELCTA